MDFSFLKGIPARIGEFLSSATRDVGEFPDVIRQQLRPPARIISPLPGGYVPRQMIAGVPESEILENLRQTLTKGEKGKAKEPKQEMSQMTITTPTSDGGKVTIKIDIPMLESGFERFGRGVAPPIASMSGELVEAGRGLPDPLLPAILALMESGGLTDPRMAEFANPFGIMDTGGLVRYPDLQTAILGGGGRLGLSGVLRPGGLYSDYLQSGNIADFFRQWTPEGQGNPSLEELIQRYNILRNLFTQ